MIGTWNAPIQPLHALLPGFGEKPGGIPPYGVQQTITVPLVATTAASTNYVTGAFTAPCDGWFVSDAWVSAQVTPNYASTTIALENYDASGNAAKNLLSATNQDLETLTAKEGAQLTLSATLANRLLDEGDTIIATVAVGASEVAAGVGLSMTLVLLGPVVTPQ